MKETVQDIKLIGKIVRRYRKLLESYNDAEIEIPRQLASITKIREAHAQEPLDLEKLYAFPEGDFGHDVGGILRYARTGGDDGAFSNFFWPRCGGRKAAT